MTMNLEAAAPAVLSSGRQDRQHARARQDRWLFELEHAMLSQGNKKGGQGVAAHAATPPADAPPASSAAAAPETLDSGDAALRGPIMGMLAPPSLASDHAMPAPSSVAEGAAAMPAAMASALPAAHAAVLNSVEAPPGAVSARTRPGAPAASPGVNLATAPAEAGMDEPGDAPSATPAPADPQEYALRQMHVYRGNEGVHAWIRDATLSDAQGRLLAQAMTLELSGAGARLKALTVNGKILETPDQSQRDANAADCFVGEAALADATRRLSITKDAV